VHGAEYIQEAASEAIEATLTLTRWPAAKELTVNAYVSPYRVPVTAMPIGNIEEGATVLVTIEAADLLAAVPAGDDWEVVFNVAGFGFANHWSAKVELTLDSVSKISGMVAYYSCLHPGADN
jgi:hypothetical protein